MSERKYKVIQGDIFGGFSTIIKDIFLEEAIEVEKNLDNDWFTTSHVLRNEQNCFDYLNIKEEFKLCQKNK